MNLVGCRIIAVVFGLMLGATIARAQTAPENTPAKGPMLTGKGHFAVSLTGEYSTRDMKVSGQKERERVARQGVQLGYGILDQLDLYGVIGNGNITFEEANLESHNRPYLGFGARSSFPLQNDLLNFMGFSAQYLFGKVSKFDKSDSSVTVEDKWNETQIKGYVGTRDFISDPEPDLRFYAGLRVSTRNDKLAPQNQSSSTVKQDHPVGGIIGLDYSDRNIFRIDAEIGAGDTNSILVRIGLIF